MKLLSLDQAGLVLATTTLASFVTSPVAASTFDCKNVRTDQHAFDLSSLKGPHSVTTTKYHPPEYYNTTYTLDICAPLKHSGKSDEGKVCPSNTRVCAIEHMWDPNEEEDRISGVYPIAGDLKPHGGYDMDVEAKRLSTSDSTGDGKQEGLRLVLNGGAYPLHAKDRQRHKAIIELLCDKDKEGTEGEWDPEEKYDSEEAKDAAARKWGRRSNTTATVLNSDDKEDDDLPTGVETQFKYENSSLIFDSFKMEGSDPAYKILRLTWYTKYACESSESQDPDIPEDLRDPSSSWGFFTWLVVVVFLGIAAYLIFGSWLNYNRYGARGWDLLPHGDTLRDVPYLIRDWARRVLSSVQAGGSHGGYSAV